MMIDDNELMLQVQQGNIEKLGILFERHRSALQNYCFRLTRDHQTSEDLVQEVFVRVLKYRRAFGPESQFCPWLYQITRNAYYSYLRKMRHEVRLHSEPLIPEPVDEAPCPDELLQRSQELQFLREALEKLSYEKREALFLSCWQNLKSREIALRLGCNVSTVKVRVFRATRDIGKAVRAVCRR